MEHETEKNGTIQKAKKNITVLGRETEFDGMIAFTDNLVITGTFSGGPIQATGDLEIEKSGVCNVDAIEANAIVISGKVTGDMKASERVEMCAGSKVTGNVTTAHIRIADNVEFEGQVAMLDSVPDVDLFSVASAEYKKAMVLKSDDPR
ncbi:MAG: polymer-forming cytoskeletal protein [Treponemataceae bacterium]|nr:polymer-forming cytoskeletal protein [Treponemataceae bacterium]